MSFYGKQFYEKGLSFRNLVFKNSGKDKETYPDAVDKKVFEATSSEDQGAIELGNRWIQIAGAEKGEANGVRLFHAPPGGTATVLNTVSSTKSLTDEEIAELKKENKQLHFGQGVVFEAFEYDKAGHIIRKNEDMWLMPSAPAVDLADKVQADIEELQEVVGIGDNIPDTALVPRVSELEESKANTSTVEEIREDLDDVIESNATLRKEFGTLGNMGVYGDTNLIKVLGNVYNLKGKWDSNDTVFGVIGKLDDLKLEETSKSIVDAINKVVAAVQACENSINTINIALEGLDERLKLLEAQQ